MKLRRDMNQSIVTIDGSHGEGGGQVLRSSLALSLVTGRPLVIEHIRARRKKPGLMRQHLTAVEAAAQIGRAEVTGAALGASRLEFRPCGVAPGDYTFRVGTAGSATLVLQTVLPALLLAEGASDLALEGGTHNPLAPPWDFLAQTYLPLVRRMGPAVETRLVRPGFYPAGGGRFTVHVQPARQLARLDLMERGELLDRHVRALVANLPRHIAQRECQTIAKKGGWGDARFSIEEVADSRGPGNVVLIELQFENVTEVFAAFGQIGVRAETVALRAFGEARSYLDAGVPVGSHLADQLVLPLGIGAPLGSGGGIFRTMALTQHAMTHLDLLRRFLEISITVEQAGRDDVVVRIG
jgi:RNA 3'-terminal phosphate cyclase (ATP)